MTQGRRYTITFGSAHLNPLTGLSLGGKYIQTPPLPSRQDARDWAFRRFNQHWAFEYKSPEEAGADKYALEEVEWDEDTFLTCERFKMIWSGENAWT
jgi:hypothetical protein